MGWLSRRKEGTGRDPLVRVGDTFVPREWDEFFGGLAPEERREASARVCRKVVAAGSLTGEDVERAIADLTNGHIDPDRLRAIQSLVERVEGEHESLVGGDEAKLSSDDPAINEAFLRARAATALQRALEGDFREMAYEAWFVLDDLNEVRRLVGMPRPDG